MKRVIYVSFRILTGLFFCFSAVVYCISRWIADSLDVSFAQIVNTVREPMEGVDPTSFLNSQGAGKQTMILCALVLAFILTVIAELVIRRFVNKGAIGTRRIAFYRGIVLSLSVVLSAGLLSLSWIDLRVGDYISASKQVSTIYEDHYVKTEPGLISLKKPPRNLVFIYLESMETTFADRGSGGSSEEDLIPNLTLMAEENTSFSSGETVGAMHVTAHADYTKGALFASTTGTPYFSVIAGRGDYTRGHVKGAAALGDILESYGYTNEFICGSDAGFGGREAFLREHGDYRIMDYYAAVEKGYIPEGYSVWWGYEDKRLYEIARSELSELAGEGKPFNCTILTVDTHYPSGYVCELCGDEYDDQFSNVVACADRQVKAFVDWCSQQLWYENTTIVIMGDHPSMNKTAFADIPAASRTVYNCFIHSAAGEPENERSRISTTYDAFPTTLSALGFEIKGHRLGFGTDLYSGERTLAETMGFDELNEQISMKSKYKGLVTSDPMEWDGEVDASSVPQKNYLEDAEQE